MTNSSKSSGEGGNTITPSDKPEQPDKPKQPSAAKYWPFTWNNYPSNWKEIIVPKFQHLAGYIIGVEIGEEGTPHLQGYIEFKDKARPMGLLPKEVHWEKRKGTREDNVRYCSKDGNFIASGTCVPAKELKIIKFEQLREWQHDIISIIQTEPDNRIIYWYHGEYGIGKTQFSKYLAHHHGAIPLGGELRHMLAVASEHQECELFIVPLCKGEFSPPYTALEQIKDGFFMSHFGTKNTKPVIMNSPHMIVFANCEPDYDDKGYHPGKYIVRKIPDSDCVRAKEERCAAAAASLPEIKQNPTHFYSY